jgi:hypothetical protein
LACGVVEGVVEGVAVEGATDTKAFDGSTFMTGDEGGAIEGGVLRGEDEVEWCGLVCVAASSRSQ